MLYPASLRLLRNHPARTNRSTQNTQSKSKRTETINTNTGRTWLPTEKSSLRSTLLPARLSIPRRLIGCQNSVKPTRYELDLYNLDTDKFTYDGTVKISLQMQEKTSSISVNSKELTLHEGTFYVESTEATVKVSDIACDKKTEVAKLTLADEIPGEGTGLLTIKFSGALNHEMAGFYRSAYKNQDGKDDWMFSTQFESSDARRAFPW